MVRVEKGTKDGSRSADRGRNRKASLLRTRKVGWSWRELAAVVRGTFNECGEIDSRCRSGLSGGRAFVLQRMCKGRVVVVVVLGCGAAGGLVVKGSGVSGKGSIARSTGMSSLARVRGEGSGTFRG